MIDCVLRKNVPPIPESFSVRVEKLVLGYGDMDPFPNPFPIRSLEGDRNVKVGIQDGVVGTGPVCGYQRIGEMH